jgi:PQQ-dependent catabolism-associated CXXCW motif protein
MPEEPETLSLHVSIAGIRRAAAAMVLILVACLFWWPLTAGAAEPAYDHLDPVTGYRIERYQAAVPETPPAGERVWIPRIDSLVDTDRAVLVDVSPITGLGYDPKTGQWRNAKPHSSLPGAVWLPEVGRGVIDDTVGRFFETNLARLTDGDKARPVILFCHADCWMSWNAMKRAAGLGYTRLYWFPEGTDGWRDWDRTLTPIAPTPIEVSGATGVP